MISDVPVGVLLSGGVDSTGVLRYAAEETSNPIHTFTMGFTGEEFADERPYARLAAQRYGTLHHERTMTAEDFATVSRSTFGIWRACFRATSDCSLLCNTACPRIRIKVLLSGEGGDEAFGGYQNYRNLLLLEGLKSSFGPAKGLLRFGLRLLGQAGWQRAGKYSLLVDPPLEEYYLSRTETPFTAFNQFRKSIYTKDFAEYLSNKVSDNPTKLFFAKVKDQSILNRMLYVDTKTWLPDDLLVKADK